MATLAGLLSTITGTFWFLVGSVVRVAATALDTLLTPIERALPRLPPQLVGVVWGAGTVVFVVAASVVLRLVGVDDVYAGLDGFLGGTSDADATDADAGTAPDDVADEDVTDSQGNFSADRLHQVTGLQPTEFLHLVVQANGGRIEQSTLCGTLPWSKSTVSRYLDDLEEAGVLERVSAGNRNVVCTPDEVPGGGTTAANGGPDTDPDTRTDTGEEPEEGGS